MARSTASDERQISHVLHSHFSVGHRLRQAPGIGRERPRVLWATRQRHRGNSQSFHPALVFAGGIGKRVIRRILLSRRRHSTTVLSWLIQTIRFSAGKLTPENIIRNAVANFSHRIVSLSMPNKTWHGLAIRVSRGWSLINRSKRSRLANDGNVAARSLRFADTGQKADLHLLAGDDSPSC